MESPLLLHRWVFCMRLADPNFPVTDEGFAKFLKTWLNIRKYLFMTVFVTVMKFVNRLN